MIDQLILLNRSAHISDSKVAAFPMYDFPHLVDAHNVLWRSIARLLESAGVADVPKDLNRVRNPSDVWNDPNLLLSQTCGFPLSKHLSRTVQLVATPRYKAEGCRRAFYRSCIVVRADDDAVTLSDLRGKRCAVNEWSSNSGMNVFRATIAPLADSKPFFDGVLVSGSHINSLRSIVENRADVAAIDCVSFAHIQKLAPELIAAVRILGWTGSTPALPFVTSLKTDSNSLAALRQALTEVSFDPGLASARELLLIDGFEVLPFDSYKQILELEHYATNLCYPQIC